MIRNAPAMINVTKMLCATGQEDLEVGGDEPGDTSPRSERRPQVIWNITRRCQLSCLHCHSDSTPRQYPGELTLKQMVDVVDDLARFRVPAVQITGGEPMLHPHFYDLAGYAIARGLNVSISCNGTRMDSHAATRLKDLGVAYVGISLDGTGENHDQFRRRPGAFRKSVNALQHCRGAGQKAGFRFKLSRQNIGQLAEIFRLIEEEDVPRVCFQHLAATGRGEDFVHPGPTEIRHALRTIADAVHRWNRESRNTEVLTANQPADAAFFWLTMRRRDPARAAAIFSRLESAGAERLVPGVEISNIDSQGGVHPGEFWENHTFGSVKERPFSEIWEESRNDALVSVLRLPRLRGRCGRCRFQGMCGGGFRARAFQKSGDPCAEDPGCYLRDYEIAAC